MFIRLAILIMFLVPKDFNPKEIETFNTNVESKSYLLNKDSVDQYPLAEVMAAIAYHECYDLSKLERWLIMEAFHNRLIYNFNNNGSDVKSQLLAPKQFTGLWKYNPEQFKFDTNDTICIQNFKMAESIIQGNRVCTRRIYYWAGKCDRNTSHGKFVNKDKLGVNTVHWFR